MPRGFAAPQRLRLDSPRIVPKSRSATGRDDPTCARRIALLALVAGAWTGCGDDPSLTSVSFHVLGPPEPLAEGGCPPQAAPVAPSIPGADRIRVTYRGTAGGPLICDAVLPLDGARRAIAIPDGATASPVDIWIEYLPDPTQSVTRSGAGVTHGVDLTAGGDVDVRIWPAAEFACASTVQLTGRAFHSVTLLPTGEVLLVGGAVADPAGVLDTVTLDSTGRRQLYASAHVELYDPVRMQTRVLSAPSLAPRAFHHAALVSTDPIKVAIYGGMTVNGDAAMTPVAVEGLGSDPARLLPGPQAISAPIEMLTYDPGSATVNVELVDAAGGQGLFSAAAPDGPVGVMPPVLAGGWEDATRAAAFQVADVLDPATFVFARQVALPSPRIGATATALDADTALLWGGHIPPLTTPPSPPGERLTGMSGTLAVQALTIDGASTTPTQRAFHAAARSGDGSVIIAGGFAITAAGATAPDPLFAQRVRVDTTTLVSDLTVDGATPAGFPDALALPGGDVLITGGSPAAGSADCAPTDTGLGCVAAGAYLYRSASTALEAGAAMVRPRYGHRTLLLADGTVMVTGGLGLRGAVEVVDDVEIYDPRTADPIADLAPGIVREPGDVARDADQQPVAACPIIEIAPPP